MTSPLAALRKLADEMQGRAFWLLDETLQREVMRQWASTLDSALCLLGEGEPVLWVHPMLLETDRLAVECSPMRLANAQVPLYLHASPVPAAVVLPDEMMDSDVPHEHLISMTRMRTYTKGWNACLAETKRLNAHRESGNG